MKIAKFVAVLAVFLVALTTFVSAENTDLYSIKQVKVDGITVDGDVVVYAERGSSLPVEVIIEGTLDCPVDEDCYSEYDARVKAWIGGYEYGEVKDVTSAFEIESGVTYKKTLSLDLPNDMDASDDYTLHVEVYDDDNEYRESYTLRVQETRHLLAIQDVIFRPSLTEIDAGRPLFTTVRVENLGDNKEEDIKVTVKIPELGLETRDYIDELTADEDRDEAEDNEYEEDSASSDELYLRIPDNVQSGYYDVVVEVEYNRGHDVVRATKSLYINGVQAEETQKTVISVDGGDKEIVAGEDATYKVMFANLGDETKIYTVEVTGAGSWADVNVEPSFVAVKSESTGEAYITVTPNEDAKAGQHMFTVQILEDGDVVKEVNLVADVEAKESGWDIAKTVLAVAFIVLLIVLIILAIALAVRAGRRDDDDELEPTTEEGQTYY